MAIHKYPPGLQELLKKTGFRTPPVPLHYLSGIESVITPSEGVMETSDIPTPSEGVETCAFVVGTQDAILRSCPHSHHSTTAEIRAIQCRCGM